MKKFLSILMVLTLLLSLSVTAFAAEETGSITVTNATVGQKYYLYKFFDASYATDENGNKIYDEKTGKAIVSYTIDKGNQFFAALFGDGTKENEYFIYDAYDDSRGSVTRRATVLDSAVIKYLDGVANSGTFTPFREQEAQSKTVKFENLPTGYYLLDRGIESVVTITSNLPDVKVIDKNQKPNVDDSFNKQVWDEDTKTWVENNSAKIGDTVNWKIDFVATNYDGDELVRYYTVRDIKSDSLWVEFNSVKVKIGDQVFDKSQGYYFCAGESSLNTGEWTEGWASSPAAAKWYLIHYTYDNFEIVIPWLDDYTFKGVTNATQGYELTFDLNENDNNDVLSESMYSSPSNVELTYSAVVGPDAANTTARNTATLDWITAEGPFGPEDPEITETKVYNMGITKTADDGTSTTAATRLAGAVFALYKDKDCTEAIHVIPTNNEGVYILDDIDADISGTNRKSSRDVYKAWVENCFDEDGNELYYDADGKAIKLNLVETPKNGQVVIMGLAAGTYYLKEVKAPSGYNKLGAPIEVTVGSGDVGIYSNGYKDLEDKEITYTVYTTTVVNKTGAELPSTGGEGTFWLITIGSLLAIGFAVFLITHKKMSVYTD